MDFKLLGSMLLIIGTSIGAGMLALPIVTGTIGFWGAIVLLVGCWILMTLGAFLLLEVNLWLPTNSNLNTMARETLGPLGQIISWISFLFLLYSLLCAYIGGGSSLFNMILKNINILLPPWLSSILFTAIFGVIVFAGITMIDYVNRGLMILKFSAYFILVILLMPFVSMINLNAGDSNNMTNVSALMVTVTSFGYAAIVPSLRIYLAGDVLKLKKAIFIGSFVPLICYILWDFVIMGTLPLQGEHGLIAIQQTDHSTGEMVNALKMLAHTSAIDFFSPLFTSVCVLTSFLGVALCLTDFWADALQVEKKGYKSLIITLLTLGPPLLVVIFIPGIFLKALKYAGIDCVILLVALPALMALKGRTKYQAKSRFKVFGGSWTLYLLILLSVLLIFNGILSNSF